MEIKNKKIMQINITKKNSLYKEIWVTSLLNGIPIPYLIKEPTKNEIKNGVMSIDTLYGYTPFEKERIIKSLPQETINDLKENYMNRRTEELKIFNNNKSRKKRKEKIDEFKEKELKQFLEKFPQYKEIIS